MVTVPKRTRGPRIPVPESGVLRACLDLLAAERIWHRRWNSGSIRNEKGRPVKFGRKGDGDIVCTPEVLVEAMDEDQSVRCSRMPVVLWVECKSDIGRQTKEQREFQSQVEAAGHYYLIVRSSDDLLNWLREHRRPDSPVRAIRDCGEKDRSKAMPSIEVT